MNEGALETRMDVQIKRGKLAELIEDKMFELRLKSYQDFADKFNIGRSTLYELLRGRSRTRGAYVHPRSETMIALAHALERPLHEIIYYLLPDAPGAEYADELEEAPAVKRVEVGVAGWVGAGPEQFEWCDEKIWVEEDFARGKDLLAFRVRGDSMAAGRRPIYDGDLVIVNRKDKGFNNAPVVARLSSGAYVCKLLKDDKFSDVVMLASANPEHLNGTPTSVPPEHVAEIVGRVVRIIHDEPDVPFSTLSTPQGS